MNPTSVTAIRWLHGSSSLFMAAFADGAMMVLDLDKDDAPFRPENTILSAPGGSGEAQSLTFHVSKPILRLSTQSNPISHWKISTKSVTAFAFSPDDQHVAVVGSDGLLRVINFVHETLYDIYQAYYGGLTCVVWSPDGRYILTGGEDDLVTIWAFREQRIIARCQGHSSWVTGVAFDPWHCDDENIYRFASVGEDAKLILWDFSVHAIHRPKARSNIVSSRNGGTGGGGRHRGSSVSSQHIVIPPPPPGGLLGAAATTAKAPTLHALQAKTHVAFLQPTVVKTIHADPCVAVYFRKDIIITTDKRGRICMWRRPRPSPIRH
ncbi:WD40-repeat-containing domain protein [Dichotomocladium elegans]|nr:WD40-repeat-containing domain protein [Dichotomocladium elegans]